MTAPDGLFEVRPPSTGAEIVAELRRVEEEMTAFFRALDADTFLTAQGEKWSPADHLRHLTKSARPLTQGLMLPGFVLALRFGRAKRPSRPFMELGEAYRARLAQGVSAGRFAPTTASRPEEGEEAQARILESWRDGQRDLIAVARGLKEAKLDRCQAPHPALELLTIREHLFFVLLHNVHHARLVAERLEG